MWLVNRDVRISKVAGQAAVTYTAVRLRSHYADFQRRETKGRSRQLQLPSLVIFTFHGLYAATFRHISLYGMKVQMKRKRFWLKILGKKSRLKFSPILDELSFLVLFYSREISVVIRSINISLSLFSFRIHWTTYRICRYFSCLQSRLFFSQRNADIVRTFDSCRVLCK